MSSPTREEVEQCLDKYAVPADNRIRSLVSALLDENERQADVVEAVREALEEGATLYPEIRYRKPTHGTCCTCQGCGQPNEFANECACASNEIHKALAWLDGDDE
jgi:hypothetical protein